MIRYRTPMHMPGSIGPEIIAQVGIPFGIATIGVLVWLGYLSITPVLFGIMFLALLPMAYYVGRNRG